MLRHNILARVAGMRPEQLEMMLGEEIRVITENPFEFEDDDEATFRALLPHEVAERKGVLSAKQHDLQVGWWPEAVLLLLLLLLLGAAGCKGRGLWEKGQ